MIVDATAASAAISPELQDPAHGRGPIVCAADIARILERIPHRYPFVLVDRLLECTPMKSARALKNVSRSEPFFDGMNQADLRVPQMLIVEAMAQTCALLCSFSVAEHPRNTYFFAGIDNCRFGTTVVPGDQIILEAVTVRMARGYGKYRARAFVCGAMAAESDLIAVVVQRPGQTT